MDENVIKSNKIKLEKKFRLLWIIIAALLIVVVVISCIRYAGYKKGQEVAVEVTLASTDYFDYYKDDYNKLVSKIYDLYHNSDAGIARVRADRTFGSTMTELGYDCHYGSDYLKYIGYIDYTLNNTLLLFIIWAALAIIIALLNLLYRLDKKAELIINGDRIICKNGQKTKKEFLVKDVKSISIAFIKGLKIVGDSVKYKINLIENGDEIKSVLMEKISAQPVENAVTASQDNTTDDLVKYKELLDSDVITQEEYDAKKKQLLNL